jgi:DivIVA domain-containing protein
MIPGEHDLTSRLARRLDAMPLTPEDVANKQFTSTRLKPGYDETEVDEFLDEVEAELTRLYRENDELRSKLASAGRGEPAAAQTAPAPAAVPDPALARENEELRQKLAGAQRQLAEAANRPAQQAPPAQAAPAAPQPQQPAPSETATGILALAQRTADEHIAEARTQADRIIGEARTRADQLKREADDKHRQMIGSLETERSTLEREVDKLRSFEREYRSRLKNYLEGQLRELDGRSTDAPAGQAAPGQPGQGPQPGQGQGQPGQGQQPGQAAPAAAPARSPFAPGAPVGGDAPSGPPQQPQGFSDGDHRG